MANILLIDDHTDSRNILSIILKRAGYNVITAINGENGLDEAMKNSVDLALIDYKLPDINGLEVTKKLKEINPQVLIFIMTGELTLEKEIDEETRKLIHEFLFKPIDVAKLKERLQQIFPK